MEDVTSYTKEDLGNLKASDSRKRFGAGGAWDGFFRFLRRPSSYPPSLPSGLRYKAFEALDKAGVPYEIEDVREQPGEPLFEFDVNIPLFDYQQEASKALLSEGDCVLVAAPRAGKTRTGFSVIKELGLPTIWIAPTSGIVKQTIKSAHEFFPKDQVVQVATKNWRQSLDKFLCVTTSAGMMKLPKEFWESREVLLVDEVHHFVDKGAWVKYLKKHTGHIYHRKGMSGTFFRSSGEDVALHAFLSHVAYEINTQKLMDKGRLTKTRIAHLELKGPKLERDFDGYTGKGGLQWKGIVDYEPRNRAIIDLSVLFANRGRKVLILVASKPQGRALLRRINEVLPSSPYSEASAVFVSTDTTKKKIEGAFESFREGDTQVLIGTSLVGEGIDLPSADCLIYATGGKAAVSYVQALFRVCTAQEGKEESVIIDFVDKQHGILLNHSRKRWEIASQYPVFDLQYLRHGDSVEDWLDKSQ